MRVSGGYAGGRPTTGVLSPVSLVVVPLLVLLSPVPQEIRKIGVTMTASFQIYGGSCKFMLYSLLSNKVANAMFYIELLHRAIKTQAPTPHKRT